MHEDEITPSYYIKHQSKTHEKQSKYKHTSCSFMANASPLHATNEKRHRTVITAIVCSYLDSAWAWDCNTILYRNQLLTPSNSNKQQYKRTSCWSRANTTPFHTCIQQTQSRHCHDRVFAQHARVRLQPHTALNANITFKSKRTHSNTNVLPVRPTKISAERLSPSY